MLRYSSYNSCFVSRWLIFRHLTGRVAALFVALIDPSRCVRVHTHAPGEGKKNFF